MAAGPALRIVFLTSIAALSVFIKTASAQVALPPGVSLPAGVTLMTGSQVLNPFTKGSFVVRPPSGQESRPGYARTHYLMTISQKGVATGVRPAVGPPSTGYLGETPASLACIYHLGGVSSPGCNPNTVTTLPTGGSHAIAIVDAYDYPTAAADLATFNNQFGIAAANFTVIYGTGNPANGCTNGTQPPGDNGNGWNVESALDIEMAHAMAPGAKIYLVEAKSNSFTDLFNAEQVAAKCVQANGGGYVSNSWGGDEFNGESSYDSNFTGSGVTYFFSAGDTPGTEYPCVSPNVMCIGGTTIARNGSTGAFLSESVWNDDYQGSGTGGGLAQYESRPAYQNFMSSIVGNSRGAPDFAAVADPETGVWIYNSQSEFGGWGIIGGTSVATPVIAGLFNKAGYFWAASYNALVNMYSLGQNGSLASYVTNINSGVCGKASLAGVYPHASNPSNDPANIQAVSGIHWSTCAGWGAPVDSGNPNAGAVRPSP
jgi:subtilase family serine protease